MEILTLMFQMLFSDPVLITPDTFRGANLGGMVYVNDFEGKLQK